jgi:hypothetical protein
VCRPGVWIAIPIVALLAAAAWEDASARARIIRLSRLGGAVELGAEAAFQQVESADVPDRKLERYRFDERVEILLEGTAVTAELLNFHLGASFGLRQELLSGRANSGNINTRLLTYDALLNFLPNKQVSFSLFGNRFEDSLIQNFGSDTETRGETAGARLFYANRWFPSTLVWQQLRSSSETVGGLNLSRRADTRRLVEFTGQHYSETTQASLRIRQEDVDDDSIPAVGDHRLRQANALFGYRWGSYFEKFWRSSAHYFRRDGTFAFENASATSAFFWDPTETLTTRVEYDFDYLETKRQRAITNTASFSLGHSLWEAMKTDFNVSIDRTDLTIGDRSNYAANLSLDYEKRLPWNSLLLIDLTARYRIEDRDFNSDEVPVTAERLEIEDFSGNFLENRRIDPSTIQVFESTADENPGTELIPDDDYAVTQVGDITSIDVVSGGSMAVGEVVFVNYVYEADPSATAGRLGFGYALGWDLGWLAFGYAHDEVEEHLIDGDADTRLDDSRRDTFRVDLRLRGSEWSATAAALYLRNRPSTTSDYDEVRLHQDLLWNPWTGLQAGVHLRESWLNFRKLDRETRTISAGTSLYWRFRGDWNLRFFAEFRDLTDSTSLDQRDIRTGTRVHLRFGKIDVEPSLFWTRRQRGPSLSNDLRAVLRLRRSF